MCLYSKKLRRYASCDHCMVLRGNGAIAHTCAPGIIKDRQLEESIIDVVGEKYNNN